jgi:hypothetical protein
MPVGRPTVLLAAAGMDAGVRDAVSSACGEVGATPVGWPVNGSALDLHHEPPALMIGQLPAGRRRIPDELVLAVTRDHPGTPLLLLCREPLVRDTVVLNEGRVTLLGEPLTPAKLSARLRSLLSGAEATGEMRAVLRGEGWWAARIAGPNSPSAVGFPNAWAASGGVGGAGGVLLPTAALLADEDSSAVTAATFLRPAPSPGSASASAPGSSGMTGSGPSAPMSSSANLPGAGASPAAAATLAADGSDPLRRAAREIRRGRSLDAALLRDVGLPEPAALVRLASDGGPGRWVFSPGARAWLLSSSRLPRVWRAGGPAGGAARTVPALPGDLVIVLPPDAADASSAEADRSTGGFRAAVPPDPYSSSGFSASGTGLSAGPSAGAAGAGLPFPPADAEAVRKAAGSGGAAVLDLLRRRPDLAPAAVIVEVR